MGIIGPLLHFRCEISFEIKVNRVSEKIMQAYRNSSIETQARDQAGLEQALDLGQQLQSGKAVVSDKDQLASRQPASEQPNQLPSSFDEALMTTTALVVEALGGAKDAQKRQGPNPLGPGDRGQQHATELSQAADFDKVGMGRANRIAIDAPGFDLPSPSALDRVIESEHEGLPPRDENGEHEPKQEATGFERGPSGAIENAVIGLKMRLIGFAHDA